MNDFKFESDVKQTSKISKGKILAAVLLAFIFVGGFWLITHPELRNDLFGQSNTDSEPVATSTLTQPVVQSPKLSPTSGNFFKLLPPLKGLYLGAWNQNGVGREIFEKMIGRTAPLFGGGYDTDCGKEGGSEGTRPTININCREERFKRGYVSTYAIETFTRPEDPDKIRSMPTGAMTPQDIIDGKIDADLKTIAMAIANSAKPVLWLYHREPYLQFGGYGNDGTLPLPLCDGTPGCNLTGMFGDKNKKDGPERYIAVARHIHDVVEGEIRRSGKKSPISWVMGALSVGELMQPGFYSEWYPGNTYVDWHAFNWYPLEMGSKSIGTYESLSATPGWKEAMQFDSKKPVLILEFGVSANQGDRSGWFKSFFEDVRTNSAMKNLAGFIYWQEAEGVSGGDISRWRLPKTDSESTTWKEELAKHPEYWNSTLRFTE